MENVTKQGSKPFVTSEFIWYHFERISRHPDPAKKQRVLQGLKKLFRYEIAVQNLSSVQMNPCNQFFTSNYTTKPSPRQVSNPG